MRGPDGLVSGGRAIIGYDWIKEKAKDLGCSVRDLSAPLGMTLHGCSHNRVNGSRCSGFPNKKLTKADASVSYTPTIEFISDDALRRFQELAIAAVDRYLGGQR
jgi:hypothetical protein